MREILLKKIKIYWLSVSQIMNKMAAVMTEQIKQGNSKGGYHINAVISMKGLATRRAKVWHPSIVKIILYFQDT
jgi:hypothetical protein